MAEPTQIGRTNDLAERLKEAGLLPANCVRFVIDSGKPCGIVTIHWQCLADEKILEVIAAHIAEVDKADIRTLHEDLTGNEDHFRALMQRIGEELRKQGTPA